MASQGPQQSTTEHAQSLVLEVQIAVANVFGGVVDFLQKLATLPVLSDEVGSPLELEGFPRRAMPVERLHLVENLWVQQLGPARTQPRSPRVERSQGSSHFRQL